MENELKKKAMAMLDRRQMSRTQLIKKLVEKGAGQDEAESTADWLCSIGALNDGQFAQHVAQSYARRGYGAAKVRQELYRRGIDRETAEAVIENMEPSCEAIDRFVSARLKGRQPDKEETRRIYAALRRRGHGYEEIKRALSRYIPEDMNFDS